MGRHKKVVEIPKAETGTPIVVEAPVINERLEFLEGLYKTLKDEGITRISDLENKIAEARK